jgi:hypothetical protein
MSSRKKTVRFVRLAILIQIAIMRMRGGCPNSSPAVVRSGVEGPDEVDRLIENHTAGSKFTIEGYERRFYGASLAGEGVDFPAPLPWHLE